MTIDRRQVKAEASWDSTVHECPQLSRGGSWPEQRVYLTVRAVVQLSHPADMQLVLRKRICVNVNPGRQGFAHNFLRRMSTRSTIPGCGVTFEVVSNIPGVRRGTGGRRRLVSIPDRTRHVSFFSFFQDAPGSEDREMLARMAASAHNSQSGDDEAAIEKYLRSVMSLENILTLDRLRQVEGEPPSTVNNDRSSGMLNVSDWFELVKGSSSEGAADWQGEE